MSVDPLCDFTDWKPLSQSQPHLLPLPQIHLFYWPESPDQSFSVTAAVIQTLNHVLKSFLSCLYQSPPPVLFERVFFPNLSLKCHIVSCTPIALYAFWKFLKTQHSWAWFNSPCIAFHVFCCLILMEPLTFLNISCSTHCFFILSLLFFELAYPILCLPPFFYPTFHQKL